MSSFNARPDFPAEEQKLVNEWKDKKIFERSVDERPEDQSYTFYDGPPFATGLPHYGHLLQSLTKDMVPRFWTMNGHRVERRWGWDCHGLPIENIVEKELDLNSRKDILEFGVDKFNESCHTKILTYAEEWKKTVARLGRWVDMDNDYKTMDLSYMNSVWWVFKSLWDRDLVYRGRKSMHICPRCETVLSNFEVAENYQDVEDFSVTAKFKLKDENVFVLAWTTTPWTLPGNMFLAVNPGITYVKVQLEESVYILAKERVGDVVADREHTVLGEVAGKDLVGKEYEPLFEYFADREHTFKIVEGAFATTEEGTGVVHIAAGFGADDAEVAEREGVEPFMHVQMNGKFTDDVKDFAGRDAKSADEDIVKHLEEANKVFSSEKYAHSYPHCWRCDTALLNYNTVSWFVAVTKLKNDALKSAKEIHWMPEHVKEGRFGKWLEDAKDWAISRSRYWGAPLPVWQNVDDESDVICIGSKEELEELSGQKVDDLHKHIIDNVEIQKDGKTYKRIDEVLDCWFESGSMPYAQNHYPHENVDTFMQKFPAEFIAEAQDQTTRWFYVLHVLATALTSGDKPALPTEKTLPAFKNVIVSGIILAEDGKKMSKRLNNYPEPDALFNKYGADSVRYYLATSPVVKMGNLNFSEKGVGEVHRKFIMTLWNVLSFYKLFEDKVEEPKKASKHLLDRWMLARLEMLKVTVTEGYKEYDLSKATRPLLEFVQELSTWYVRRSRNRVKGEDKKDQAHAVVTLRTVLQELSLLMAPITPFTAEMLYREVGGAGDSVHLEKWPEVYEERMDAKLIADTARARQVIEAGHALRASSGLKLRQPLASCETTQDVNKDLREIVREELNVKELAVVKKVSGGFVANERADVAIDTTLSEELKAEGMLRDAVRAINALRKKAGLTINDRIDLVWSGDEATDWIQQYGDELKRSTLADALTPGDAPAANHSTEVQGHTITITFGF